jgi:hypothetical protein
VDSRLEEGIRRIALVATNLLRRLEIPSQPKLRASRGARILPSPATHSAVLRISPLSASTSMFARKRMGSSKPISAFRKRKSLPSARPRSATTVTRTPSGSTAERSTRMHSSCRVAGLHHMQSEEQDANPSKVGRPIAPPIHNPCSQPVKTSQSTSA